MNRQSGLRGLSVLSFVAVWWLGSLVSSPEVLPGPLATGRTILANFTTATGPEEKSAAFHVAITLGRILFSFTVAMILGIAVGLAIWVRRRAELAFCYL